MLEARRARASWQYSAMADRDSYLPPGDMIPGTAAGDVAAGGEDLLPIGINMDVLQLVFLCH